MANQLQDLIHKVSGQLHSVERSLSDLHQSDKDFSEKLDDIRERVVTLERDLEWIAEAREKVDGRLETGDQTFMRIEATAKEADRIARACEKKLSKLEDEKPTLKKRILEKLAESAAAMIAGLLFWGLYHFLLVGPKIAEILKQVRGEHP